jgi:hypothetical protein
VDGLPAGASAGENRGNHPGLQASARLALDATRVVPPVGPTGGFSLDLEGQATQLLRGGGTPFGNVAGTARALRPLFGSERVYLSTRLSAGVGFGSGPFTEQFYLPTTFNLRALPQTSTRVIGNHYYVANAELRLPLERILLPGLPFLEGVAGFDIGATFFDLSVREARNATAAAFVLGVEAALGPLVPRLYFARPVDVGSGIRYDEWLIHFTLFAPYLML